MATNTPLRVAILINGFPIAVQDSFVTTITTAQTSVLCSTDTKTDFFNPSDVEHYPDPEEYDLIVLSGGTADPMGSDPWVLKLQEFIRATVDCYPQQKIVGICW